MALSEQQLLDYNRRLLRREMRELKFRVEALRLFKDELGRLKSVQPTLRRFWPKPAARDERAENIETADERG